MPITAKLDEFGKPAWIALMSSASCVWWPLGLAILAFTSGAEHGLRISRRQDRWQHKMERMESKMDRMRAQDGRRRSGGRSAVGAIPRAATAPSTNTAPRPCGGSRKSSASSATSSTGCALPRTRPSSTSSWPSGATARPKPPQPQADLLPPQPATAVRAAVRPGRAAGQAARAFCRAADDALAESHGNTALTIIGPVRRETTGRLRPSLDKFGAEFRCLPVVDRRGFSEILEFGGAHAGGLNARRSFTRRRGRRTVRGRTCERTDVS